MVIDEEINLTKLLVCISKVGQKRKIKDIDSQIRLYIPEKRWYDILPVIVTVTFIYMY